MSAPIVEDALQRKLQESETLDFKQTSYADNKEWLKDVTAFANANGGRLIIGVGQDEHGRARDAVGIKGSLDTEQQRLMNWLRTQTEPDVSPFVTITSETDSAGLNFIIVDVRDSPQKPHRIELPGDKYQRQVYVRSGTDNLAASMQQVSAVILDANRTSAEVEQFVAKRQRGIVVSNPLGEGIIPALSFIITPKRAFGSRALVEWALANTGTALGDTRYGSWSAVQPDADGAFSINGDGDAYHRIFYNGAVELTYTKLLYQHGEDDDQDVEQVVPAARVRHYTERHVGRMLELMRQATGADQFDVAVSLHGLAGVRAYWKSHGYPKFSKGSPGEDLVQLPSLTIQATGNTVSDVVPVLTLIFRAWGEHQPPSERLSKG